MTTPGGSAGAPGERTAADAAAPDDGSGAAGRLDVALVDRGLARSRSAARAAIQSGRVSVGGRVVTKPAYAVRASDSVAIEGESPYVSRAAHKLIAALDAEAAAGRPLPVAGAVALDVGASTGGFTEVLLERGADTVIALDVGHGQLDTRLALDARVAVVEGVNARDLTPTLLAQVSGVAERPSIVVGDLSFISLGLVLPALVATAGAEADYVLLIKPQFEVGRQGIREGIVRDPGAREEAIMGVLWAAADEGLTASALLSSPIVGTHGNHEYLAVFRRDHGVDPSQWRSRAAELARAHVTGAPGAADQPPA